MENVRSAATVRADINVTPLIDVLLVLLIVFMVITPTVSRGLPAAPPEAATKWYQPLEQSEIVLQIADNRSYRLNGTELPDNLLELEIHRVFLDSPQKTLYLQAEGTLEYRDVARTIDRIRGAEPSVQIGFVAPQT